jgi:hypothetical protein
MGVHRPIVAPFGVVVARGRSTMRRPRAIDLRVSPIRQLRDLIECVIVPAAIALLPFRWGLACARACAWLPLYGEYVAGFAEGAARLGYAPDPAALRRRRRLYVLLDHVDLYWNRWRDDAWFLRHVRTHGQWPVGDRPFVAVFFHWGFGLSAIRHLGASGRHASLVGRPIDPASLSHRPWQLRYARARYAAAAAAGRAPVIFWGGAKAKIAEALAQPGHVVLGAVDVPPTETHSLTPVTLLGQPTRFTHGLVRLARERAVPLVVFSLGLDAQGPILRIDPCIEPDAAALEDVMQQLADRLAERIKDDPGAWSLWAWLDAFFPREAVPPLPGLAD